MAEDNSVTLKDFLERHGARLGEKIEQNLTPVYNPLRPEGVEAYEERILPLLRRPFPVQGEVIKGISKALYDLKRRHLFVCGEMGTGKCQKPDTMVTVNDELMTIEEAYQKHADMSTECHHREGFWYRTKGEALTPSFDETTGKIVLKPIVNFYKQPIREEIKTVCLEDGSCVETTMSHKFLTPGGWTNLISRGEYVAVPRKESSLQQKKCPIKPELLAWAIGEGSFVLTNAKTRAGRLTITQKSVAVLAKLKGMIADTVPGKATVTVSQPKNRCARVSIANKGLIKLFEDNGLKWGLRSAERYIPSCLLKAPESDIVLFLKAYCDAEGFVDSTRGCLEYTTASRMLADQLRVLLRRVGIFSKLRIVKKAATNTKNRTKRNYYVVGIGGTDLRIYSERIGSDNSFKKKRLRSLRLRKTNNNLNTVYVFDILKIFKEQTGLGRKISDNLLANVYCNGSERTMNEDTARRLLHFVNKAISGELLSQLEEKRNAPSRGKGNYTKAIKKLLKADLSEVKIIRDILQYRIESDVTFIRVKSVSEQDYEGLVYDMEVKDTHSFIGNHILLHNTMIALATTSNAPTPIRALVVCPTHLVEKWIREAKETIPDVHTVDLTVKNVISVLHAFRHERALPKTHEIHVISKEKAKLSYAWRPAAVLTKRSLFPRCPACGQIAMRDDEYLTFDELSKKKLSCGSCNNPLWQADRSLRRFAPAEYIKKYLKGYYDMVIIDEIQDYKAEGTLQGRAMGALLSSSKFALCLTGTLNSGYADDLFHLLFRMEPAKLKGDGFEYQSSNKFLSSYGTIEVVRKLDEVDNVYGRGRKKAEMVRRRPGVSPVAIGKYLLDKTVFIRLADVIDGLPPYEENVLSYTMDKQQAETYGDLQQQLKQAVRAYKTKALGSMLQALLSYPDSCVQFPEHIVIRDKGTGEELETIGAPVLEFGPGELLPKERDFVDIVKKEREEERKVLCYLTFTNSRDIRPRLKRILEDEKLRVGVLETSVPPKRREEWVRKHSPEFDVLLTNAELVKTGLDLYEYPTIYSYQTGYSVFTLRQAARRSWRIGQTVPVRVFFAVYRNTMQEIALSLVAKKLEVALMVEGELPEGLADYAASGGSIVEELGKALIEGGDYTGAEKAWANFRRKEIEAQLGVSGKENVFYEKKRAGASAQTTIQGNVTVKVSFIEGKKRSRSIVEVNAGDLDSVAAGRKIQFALF